MPKTVPTLLYICETTELYLLLHERIVRDVPGLQIVDCNNWHAFALARRDDGVEALTAALFSDGPHIPVRAMAARLKELYPDCKVFVHGNMPPELIAHSEHIDGRFSAGYDEDRLVTALRGVIAS